MKEGLLPRILTALVFVPALLVLVYLGERPLLITVLALVGLMLWESSRLLFQTHQRYFKILVFILGYAIAFSILGFVQHTAFLLLFPSMLLFAFSATLLHPEPIEDSMRSLALVLLSALYSGGLIPYLFLVREQGLGLGLMALLCTWLADTGAYFAGHALGRHKLYPRVSPGKTLEGVLGGLLASVGIAVLLSNYFELPVKHALALGIIAGIFGVIGDLCESLLKRSVGAKDSSHLIPGHGGVLDRFDALMFVAPAFYIYSTLWVG